MAALKGNIRLVFGEGLEVEYASDLNIIWMIKKGSILNFQDENIIEVIEMDTYFKETDNLVSFLIVAQVRLML